MKGVVSKDAGGASVVSGSLVGWWQKGKIGVAGVLDKFSDHGGAPLDDSTGGDLSGGVWFGRFAGRHALLSVDEARRRARSAAPLVAAMQNVASVPEFRSETAPGRVFVALRHWCTNAQTAPQGAVGVNAMG